MFIRATERTTLPPTLSTSLTSALLTILTHTASVPGRAAVPKIRDSSGISPFPVRIGVKVAGVEVG
jgi:ribonucleotide reductase alpha subunit